MKSIILSVAGLLVALNVFAMSAQDAAKKAGCTLLAGDDQVCLYPKQDLSGSDAIKKLNDLFATTTGKTHYVEGNVEDCVVMWSSVALTDWNLGGVVSEEPLHGELKFINPQTGRPLLGFWFASQTQYSYQYVDKAFNVGENDFYVDHIFKVQGPASKKYEVVVYEDGDMAAGVRMSVNGQQKSLKEFCETEF